MHQCETAPAHGEGIDGWRWMFVVGGLGGIGWRGSLLRTRSSSGRRKSADYNGGGMEDLAVLRTVAAVTTVLAAALVAANLNARITVAGFIIFIVASIAWMIDGWLESKASLVIQNVILLLINAIGVWRWFPKAEKETNS